MLVIKKMRKSDVSLLYNIALRSFKADYEKYGVHPPLLKTDKKKFMPPIIFGKVLIVDGKIIGGAFVFALGKKGEIGSIFIDPQWQHKGYGKQAMLEIEKLKPKVKVWKLDTPAESTELHGFYESLGYIKTGEMKDEKSGMTGFIYQKTL